MAAMANPNADLLAIHRAFASTSHGKTLASRVRYEKYKPATVSNSRWVELLGPDVGNLSHLTFTYELASKFVAHTQQNQPGLLTATEKRVVQVAALIHDWAEAKIGDISFGDKTAEHEAAEQAAFDTHLHEFYSGTATDLINRARREVIFDHASKLGEIFNAVERVGYMITALRAYNHVEAHDAGDCTTGFRWLTTDVLLNQIPPLLTYAQKYWAVKDYLASEQKNISRAFANSTAEQALFKKYEDEEATKLAQFKTAKAAWDASALPAQTDHPQTSSLGTLNNKTWNIPDLVV